jgi:hypothetical protein
MHLCTPEKKVSNFEKYIQIEFFTNRVKLFLNELSPNFVSEMKRLEMLLSKRSFYDLQSISNNSIKSPVTVPYS